MNEINDLYVEIIEKGPKQLANILAKIPDIHKQEALDQILEKIIISTKPNIGIIKHLLKIGASPDGPEDNKGYLLSFCYTTGLYDILELLLESGANVNEEHSNVLAQAVRNGDVRYVVKFVEFGADINNIPNIINASPEIQKYFLRKGLKEKTILDKNLKNIITPSISDFDYPKIRIDKKETELIIKDYSDKFFIVTGNTVNNQDLLQKYNGKFIKNKWYIPVEYKTDLQKNIEKLSFKNEENGENVEKRNDYEIYIKKILDKNTIARPIIENKNDIELFTPIGDHGYMTLSFEHANLFYLDSQMWDSVERYLMYKKYEGTPKADAIKKAENLMEARKKFNVQIVPIAKTPRQLVINEKLKPIADSKINKEYLLNVEEIFCNANKQKFMQNKILSNRLIKTNGYIINKNTSDYFGYAGNLLGNCLMEIQSNLGGKKFDAKNIKKTNNIILEKYDNNFYVIRGDPDTELASEIRSLGTFKKAGKEIKGKLSLNLIGGPGWLIPNANKNNADDLIFDTLSEEKKIEKIGLKWIEKQLNKYIDTAIIFAKFRGKEEISSDDILFIIKDIFGEEEFLGAEDSEISDNFNQKMWEYMSAKDFTITDNATTLLWNFLSKIVLQITSGVETFQQMQDVLDNYDSDILDTNINTINNLTERESIIIGSFIRLFNLMKKMNSNEEKIAVNIIHIMIGKDHYENIRKEYSKKVKLHNDKNDKLDEELMYKKRFNIKTPHISTILNVLHTQSKKCKLLILTTLDYIMDLEGKDAIEISKRLISLSHKGTNKVPTPLPIEIISDIPKINDNEKSNEKSNNEKSNSEKSDNEKSNSEKSNSEKSNSEKSANEKSNNEKSTNEKSGTKSDDSTL